MSSEAALTVTFEDDSYSQETLEYLGETIEVPHRLPATWKFSGTPVRFSATRVPRSNLEICGRFQSITAMNIYRNKSVDELRVEDYEFMNQNKKPSEVKSSSNSYRSSGTHSSALPNTTTSTFACSSASQISGFWSSSSTSTTIKPSWGKNDLAESSSSANSSLSGKSKRDSIQAEPATLPMSVDSSKDVPTKLPTASTCNFSFTPSINFISESDPPRVFKPPQLPETGKEALSTLIPTEGRQLRDALLQSIAKCMKIQNSLYRLVLLKLQAHVAAMADTETCDSQIDVAGLAESGDVEISGILQNPESVDYARKLASNDGLCGTSSEESASVSANGATKVSNTVSNVRGLKNTPVFLSTRTKEVNPSNALNAASTDMLGENQSDAPITLLNEVKEPLEALTRCADIQRSLFQGLITVNMEEEGRVKSELFTRRDINMLAVESKLDAIALKTKMECGYARNPFSSEDIKASSNKDVLQHLNKRPFIKGANRVRELPHGRGTLKSATGELIYTGDWCRGKRQGQGEGLIFSTFSATLSAAAAQNGFYIGGWKHNMRHGCGKMLFSSGAVYEGQWKFDKITGYGTLTLPDGTIKEGTWRDGSLQGCAVFTWPDGANEYREYEAGRGEWMRKRDPVWGCLDIASKSSEHTSFLTPGPWSDEIVTDVTSGKSQLSSRAIEKEAREKVSQSSFIRAQLLNVLKSLTELRDEKRLLKEQLSTKKRELAEMASKVEEAVCEIREDYRKQLECATQEQQEELDKATEEVADLKRELKETKDALSCQICFTRPRDCIILPCSHMLYCRICVDEHKRNGNTRCPTCRGPINSQFLCNM